MKVQWQGDTYIVFFRYLDTADTRAMVRNATTWEQWADVLGIHEPTDEQINRWKQTERPPSQADAVAAVECHIKLFTPTESRQFTVARAICSAKDWVQRTPGQRNVILLPQGAKKWSRRNKVEGRELAFQRAVGNLFDLKEDRRFWWAEYFRQTEDRRQHLMPREAA